MKALGIDLKTGATVIIESISAGSVVVKFKVLGLEDDDAATAVGEKMKNELPKAFEDIGFGQVAMSAPLKGLAMANPSKATKIEPEKEEEPMLTAEIHSFSNILQSSSCMTRQLLATHFFLNDVEFFSTAHMA